MNPIPIPDDLPILTEVIDTPEDMLPVLTDVVPDVPLDVAELDPQPTSPAPETAPAPPPVPGLPPDEDELLATLQSRLETHLDQIYRQRLEALQRQAVAQALDELKSELPHLLRGALHDMRHPDA